MVQLIGAVNRVRNEIIMKITLASKIIVGLFALSMATPALAAGSTPWLDRDNPGGSGDWENLSALATPECVFTDTGLSTAGTAGYRCDIAAGSQCTNTAAVACRDTKVRFIFNDNRGGQATTDWLNRDQPSGTGDWELTSQLLTVECKFTATNTPMTTSPPTSAGPGPYTCGTPDSRAGGSGVNARNNGAPVNNIAVRFSW